MTVIIVNIPQVEDGADCHEMQAEEWLALAVDQNKKGLEKAIGGVAANGFVMHIADAVRIVNGNEKMFGVIDLIKSKKLHLLFMVKRQFLIEALAGINPDTDEIYFFGDTPHSPIVIQDGDATRTAIAMPMSGAGDREPILPA